VELAPVPVTLTPEECDNTTKPATQHTCNMHPCEEMMLSHRILPGNV